MFNSEILHQYHYQETAIIILVFLFSLASILFFLRKRQNNFMTAWASVKSWLLVTPLFLLALALSPPWPTLILTLASIYGCKTFFRMVGMYHRNWFVLTTYAFIVGLGLMIHYDYTHYYDAFPMLFLGAICLIPILRNSSKHMIQYIALSFLGFIFLAWSFMYLGLYFYLDKGTYIILYLVILSEFSENSSLAVTRFFGKIKICPNIYSKLTLEGLIISVTLTLLLAWGLRHLLPDSRPVFWITAALVTSLLGRMGDIIISVIRRDLGIRDTGVFIIGRDDIIARMDKFIFIAPSFYYLYTYYLRNL